MAQQISGPDGDRQKDYARSVDRASRWRLRATELRAAADNLHTQDARDTMREIADSWDRMADTAERRAGRLRSGEPTTDPDWGAPPR